MKVLLAVIVVWAATATAEDCKSIWIYQQLNSCPAYGNPGNGQVLEVTPAAQIPVGPVDGGKNANATAQCAAAASVWSKDLGEALQMGEVRGTYKPDDSNRDIAGHVTYTFYCLIRVVKIPYVSTYNPKCGVNPKWQSEMATKPFDVKGIASGPICLSADNVPNALERLDTLANNFELIKAKLIDNIRPEDLKAMAASLDEINKYGKGNLDIPHTEKLETLTKEVTSAAGN